MSRILKLSTLIILSCIAAGTAHAEIITSGDAIVVQGRRVQSQQRVNEINQNIRSNNIQIYTDGSSNGQAYIMRNGRLEPMADGEYVLPSGNKVKITNGRLDAKFGNGNLNNDIKVLPRN